MNYNAQKMVCKTTAVFLLTLLCTCFLVDFTAHGQAFRSQFTQIRATVPVNSTNVTILGGSYYTNNTVILVNGATNANFDITGLPAGAAAVLTDGFGNPMTSTTKSTNLWITLYTTNLSQGIYNFTLNIGGLDTNGLAVTNQFPFVLQAAHLWLGNGAGALGFGYSNNWSTASNWLGGLPAATNDVVIGDFGAQTNSATYGVGTTPDIGIDVNTTVASIRFAQNTYTNLTLTTNITGSVTNVYNPSTNTLYHAVRIANGATLAVTGTNAYGGFSLLRDTIAEFGFAPDSSMGVIFYGTNGTLAITNVNANFAVLPNDQEQPTMNFSNLGTLSCTVSRLAFSDFRGYPNYQGLSAAYNAGRDTNSYAGIPRRMWSTIYLARTNFIKATYVDPNHYTNEYTRTYALTVQNNEQSGNGSSVNTYFYLGRTNIFYLDSICFIGSSSASGNTGGTKFNAYNERTATNPGAVFRGPDGVSRMSLFCVSDDGGTNNASSNVKSTTDFSFNNYGNTGVGSGYINLLADQLYVARDRTMIASNQSPNVQGDLIFGGGIVDVNWAWLGCQEHSNKVDWTSLYGASPYLNYCQGRLVVTNNPYTPSVFRVNRTLTLGYTADNNPAGSAQQYNTYGQVTIYTNVTFMVSNIVCDGGLNYMDGNGRNNIITINQGGTLVVSNTIGFPNDGANDFSAADPRGIWLDSLAITAGKLVLFVDPVRTNVFTRTLSTPGILPSVIKVAALNNVTSFPTNIPIIAYRNSTSPFLNADVTALGAGYYGYILNDSASQTVDLYVTTNSPNNLIWTGAASPYWNTTDNNWVVAGTGTVTNFNLGDIVTFNDSSLVTNVIIDGSMVPGQTGTGVTISNSVNQYVFSGGTIAGTALVVKQGTNLLEFDATEQGPIQFTGGTITGSGQLGVVTVYTNVVLNYNGNINGGLTSTGMVAFAGTEYGPVSIQAGTLDNNGTLNTTLNQVITMAAGTAITNEAYGNINAGTGAGASGTYDWDVPAGSVLANFGAITLYQPRISVEGLFYGNGTVNDPNGGGHESIANGNAPRVVIQGGGVISPGLTATGSISSMKLQCRFDLNNDPTAAGNGLTPGYVRVEVDFSQSPSYDILNVDRWNNDTGYLLMTNINPAAGSFAVGQSFQVFNNANSGDPFNYQDTPGFCVNLVPTLPGPGMVWGTTNFNLYGIVTVASPALVWDGSGSGSWDTNGSASNWKSGQTFADNLGAVFDDRATGSTVVNLTTNVAPEGYPSITVTNTDSATYTNIITTTNQPAFYPGIIISNAVKNYVITGPGHIHGMTGIYKTGPGTCTLMTSNDYIGCTIIDNGVLAVTNYGGTINIMSLGVTGSGAMKNEVVLDGGTLSYVGTTNVQLNHYVTINPNGGTVAVASSTNLFSLNDNVVGAGGLTLAGPGTVQLSSTTDNYPGGTTVTGGALRLTAAAVGYGPVTLNNLTALLLTNNFTLTNGLNVVGSGVSVQILGASTNVLGSPWTGAGSVTISNANPLIFTGDLSLFSGTLSFGTSSGTFQFNIATNKNPCLGSAAATFDLGTGSATLQNFNGSNLTYNLGALSGGVNTVLTGRSTNSLSPAGTIYSIGANGVSTSFNGKITNGLDTVSIVKTGAGTLWLNGVSTYTGPTAVNSGVLGGSGSLASPLTVAAGATLAPGASATSIGTFTVSNSATLGGALLLKLNRTNSPAINDLLAVTGTLTAGGSLVVTNIGTNIVNGTKFTLFNKAVTGFASVVLPASDPSNTSPYTWNNNLASDGSITLATGGIIPVNTNPANIVTGITNGVLTLAWPVDHTGWRLQVQTNPLSGGLGTNWYTVPGSTNVATESFNLDVNQGSIFYRMVYP